MQGPGHRDLGTGLGDTAGTGASMVGKGMLLLAGFLLPGFLLSEAIKILTTFSLGECLAGESESGVPHVPALGLRHTP